MSHALHKPYLHSHALQYPLPPLLPNHNWVRYDQAITAAVGIARRDCTDRACAAALVCVHVCFAYVPSPNDSREALLQPGAQVSEVRG